MKVYNLFIRYKCKHCGYNYTDVLRASKNVALHMVSDFEGMLDVVHNPKRSCFSCRKTSVRIAEIKGVVIDDYKFRGIKKEPKADNRELLPVLLTWVCKACTYSWDTTENFTSEHTKHTRLPFIVADKRCPNCKSESVKLFSQKGL